MDQQNIAIRPHGFAVNGDDTYVETPTKAHEMNIRLNRVSGRVQVNWCWHCHWVHDYLPLGVIRSIGKRHIDHKLFTSDCDVMRQRLFWRECGLSCAAFGSGIDKRLNKQVLVR